MLKPSVQPGRRKGFRLKIIPLKKQLKKVAVLWKQYWSVPTVIIQVQHVIKTSWTENSDQHDLNKFHDSLSVTKSLRWKQITTRQLVVSVEDVWGINLSQADNKDTVCSRSEQAGSNLLTAAEMSFLGWVVSLGCFCLHYGTPYDHVLFHIYCPM